MAHAMVRAIDVVLNGFFNVTQPLLMPMIHPVGRIVNIASVVALSAIADRPITRRRKRA